MQPIHIPSIKQLLGKGITVNEFVFCTLLYEKEFALLKAFIASLDDSPGGDHIITSMIDKRLIKDLGYRLKDDVFDYGKLSLRTPFLELINVDSEDGPFEELRIAFPKKTPEGRRLHLKVQDAKKLYLSIIAKDPALHQKILKALKLEISERKADSSEMYMKNLYSWIYRACWNTYIDDAQMKKEIDREGEGERFKTRIL